MKKRVFSVVAFSLLLLFLFSSCTVGRKSDAKVFEKITPASVSGEKNTALSFSNEKREKLSVVSRTDMTVLYFDEKTFSVCVYDAGSNKLWRSLPESETDENAFVLSVCVIAGGKEYTLFSQSDCVAFGNADYALGNDGVTVNYRFEKTLGNEKADFTVPVRFTAQDGMLVSSVNCKDIEIRSGDITFKSLSLLGWFGADREGKSGDFILVPDGCGAIIDTSKKAEKFESLSLKTYGGDPSLDENENAVVCVPAFGKKSGEAAFVALVENGDAISSIHASKSLKKSGFNRVFPSFELTETMDGERKTYVSKSTYDGLISVSYRFLSGENANYVSMASACRELLIRSSVLSMNERTTAQSEGLPFELTLIASAKLRENEKRGNGQKVLTTLFEARDIVSFLRSKGIKNITLRLEGLFEGGLVQKDFSSATLFSSVGTKKELEEFMEYAKSQNIGVYADVGLFTACAYGSKSAVKPNGEKTEPVIEPLKTDFFSSNHTLRFSPSSEAEKNADRLIASLRGYGFDGVSLSDAGKVLYSDFSKSGNMNREEAKKAVASRCGAISSSKNLMVSGANIYSLKYASAVSDIPYTAKCAKNEFCTAVPFLQSILHGYVDYSRSALNLEKNGENAFLKAVEYGAVPGVTWYFSDFGTQEKDDNLFYMNGAATAQHYYERMNEVFFDLRDKKITAHKKVSNGVFCTEYGSSTVIYVNYGKKDVTVGGVTVEGKSFVRVG